MSLPFLLLLRGKDNNMDIEIAVKIKLQISMVEIFQVMFHPQNIMPYLIQGVGVIV